MNLKKCTYCNCTFSYDKNVETHVCPQCDNTNNKTMIFVEIEKIILYSSNELVAISQSMEIYKKYSNIKDNIWEKQE